MKKILKNVTVNKLLMIFIIVQPILDVITSICVRNISETLTIGILIRSVFMIGISIYAIVKSSKKDRIKLVIYYLLLFIYSIAYLYVCIQSNGLGMILTQIKGLIKVFYFPIVFVGLFFTIKDKEENISSKYFIYALFGYTLTIFIAKILGIGYLTYNGMGNKLGTVGLFFAANEIGAIVSILSPILVLKMFKESNSKYWLCLVLVIFSVLEIGTKVPFVAIIVLGLVSIVICIIKVITIDKKLYAKKILVILGIFLVVYSIIDYTPVGVNVMNKYSKIIATKHGDGESKKEELKEEETEEEEKNQENNQVISAVLSSRDEYLRQNSSTMKSGTIMNKMVGNTYLDNNTQVYKLAEIDIFDIIFAHGIMGATLFLLPFIIVTTILIIRIIKNIKKFICNEQCILLSYSLAIALAISCLAGHVLNAPAVSIYIAFFIIKLFEKTRNYRS